MHWLYIIFLILITVPWACKMLTLGELSEGYMGTRCTIFTAFMGA